MDSKNPKANWQERLEQMFRVSAQSIFIHSEPEQRLQQIAACSALFAKNLAEMYKLNPLDCAVDIPLWIYQLNNDPNCISKKVQISNEKWIEKRRTDGMDFTTVENIHKVIDPLFFDDLKEEFDLVTRIQVPAARATALRELQDKIAGLKFLDPAAGCGNFLVETFKSLRRLENEIIKELVAIQKEQEVKDDG